MHLPYNLELKDLIVFAGGIIVTVFFGYLFYRRGIQKKQITYSIQTRDLVFHSRDYPSNLKITFDGRDIEALTRATVYIWNSGNQPITEQDLRTATRMTLELPNGLVFLQKSISFETRKANNVRLNGFEIEFDYLNQNDGFIIDIFAEKKVDVALRYGIKLQGEIIGAAHPPIAVDYFIGAHYMFPLVALFTGAGMLVGGGLLIPDWWAGSPHWIVSIGIAILAVFAIPAAVFAIILGLTGVYRTVPLSLVAAGENLEGRFNKFARIFKMPE
jgi:hypothetical protein